MYDEVLWLSITQMGQSPPLQWKETKKIECYFFSITVPYDHPLTAIHNMLSLSDVHVTLLGYKLVSFLTLLSIYEDEGRSKEQAQVKGKG
jgi:hypothetical protein